MYLKEIKLLKHKVKEVEKKVKKNNLRWIIF